MNYFDPVEIKYLRISLKHNCHFSVTYLIMLLARWWACNFTHVTFKVIYF